MQRYKEKVSECLDSWTPMHKHRLLEASVVMLDFEEKRQLGYFLERSVIHRPLCTSLCVLLHVGLMLLTLARYIAEVPPESPDEPATPSLQPATPSLQSPRVGEIRVATQWHSRDPIGNPNVLSRTHGTLLFAPEMEETRKQWPPIQASGLYPDITHSTCSVPDFFVTELPGFSSSVFSFGRTVRRVGTCFSCSCNAAHKAKV
jgi:hypothetical protein